MMLTKSYIGMCSMHEKVEMDVLSVYAMRDYMLWATVLFYTPRYLERPGDMLLGMAC